MFFVGPILSPFENCLNFAYSKSKFACSYSMEKEMQNNERKNKTKSRHCFSVFLIVIVLAIRRNRETLIESIHLEIIYDDIYNIVQVTFILFIQ